MTAKKTTEPSEAAPAPEAEPTPVTADEFEFAQIDEYARYVAVVDIPHGNALAYAAGHPVPVSNVKQYGYDVLGWVKERPEEERATLRASAMRALGGPAEEEEG
ncbi:MAG TPA: hypothetical protein VEO01_26420 [Pseudonocardiaceae bacterium]|nr:hypothetical protein [Pseudonocardiaceae bacterium]